MPSELRQAFGVDPELSEFILMEIYIAKDGHESGPYTKDQIDSLNRAGMIQLTDLVWHEGMPEWSPLHRFLGVRPPVPITSAAGTTMSEAKHGQSARRRIWLLLAVVVTIICGGYTFWIHQRSSKESNVLMVVNRSTWAVSDRSNVGFVTMLETLLDSQEAGTTTEREDARADSYYSRVGNWVGKGVAVNLYKGRKVYKLKDQENCSLIRMENDEVIGSYWIRTGNLSQAP